MLDPGELDRRLKAIRTLRQISQEQLGERLADAGLKKWDMAKVERGEKSLTTALRQQAAAILRVPENYLTEPDLDKVLFRTPLRPATDGDRDDLGDAGRHLEGGSQTFADETPDESQEEPGSEGGSAP